MIFRRKQDIFFVLSISFSIVALLVESLPTLGLDYTVARGGDDLVHNKKTLHILRLLIINVPELPDIICSWIPNFQHEKLKRRKIIFNKIGLQVSDQDNPDQS